MENKDSIQLTVQDSIWIPTPIRDFGFKCVMNQHDFCNEFKCACLCHHKKLIKIKNYLKLNPSILKDKIIFL
jgi:hypothetical protein